MPSPHTSSGADRARGSGSEVHGEMHSGPAASRQQIRAQRRIGLMRARLRRAGWLCGAAEVEVLVGEAGGDATARGAVEEANLDEEGLVDFFDSV